MDHQQLQDQLFALYDGELPIHERRVVEEHALDCGECVLLLAQWKRASRSLFFQPALAPSEAFVARVMRSLDAPRPRPGWSLLPPLPRLAWLIPAAGLAALLLIMNRGMLSQQDVSVETLLLSESQQPAVVQRVLTDQSLSPDELLGLFMEDSA